MTWVQIQQAEQATWDDFEKVVAALGAEQPEGLIAMAAGEVDGHWKAVSIWESKEAQERFRDERLIPAVRQAVGEELADAGPPPEEWFEAKRTIGL